MTYDTAAPSTISISKPLPRLAIGTQRTDPIIYYQFFCNPILGLAAFDGRLGGYVLALVGRL